MKTVFVAIVAMISFSALGQNSELKVSIRNCFSGVIYYFQNDTISVNVKNVDSNGVWNSFIYKTRMYSIDSARFRKALDRFLAYEWDEIFSNEEVMDGFQFKITIVSDKRVKKMYVGNAYEERADSLTGIFNQYFSREEWMKDYLRLNGAGYWDNKEWIEELIADDKRNQSTISEEKRKFYLTKFCE